MASHEFGKLQDSSNLSKGDVHGQMRGVVAVVSNRQSADSLKSRDIELLDVGIITRIFGVNSRNYLDITSEAPTVLRKILEKTTTRT
jgi:hypothetical protein